MKSITVAQLRQNPTAALAEVAAGESYLVTRHRTPVARLVPASEGAEIVPPQCSGPARLSQRGEHRLLTAGSIEELLQTQASPW